MQIDNFANLTLIVSLINLGFFGGFSHCASMCGPFVLSQVSSRLEAIKITEFTGIKKLQSLALLPYHFGRITTYSFIGFLCSLLAKNIREFANFNVLSAILLIFASLFFFQKAFETKFLSNQFSRIFRINIKFNFGFLDKLFKNPTGFNGYLLGLALGFIPCGLLYGAFAIAASIDSPSLAALAMFLFGLATTPSLLLTACGGYFFLKITSANFKLIARLVILINSATLLIMAINLLIN